MFELKEITKDNIDDILKLSVAETQKGFVPSNAHSLAQAWVYRNTAFPFAIYSDDIIVGFLMLGYYEDKDQYTLWRLMIDEKYQNRGYGKKAVEMAVKYLKGRFNAQAVYTGVIFKNIKAKNLYSTLGFVETGYSDEKQFEMKLIIN